MPMYFFAEYFLIVFGFLVLTTCGGIRHV